MTQPLRVVPLGGLGEIGMNCMVIEYETDAVMIDCGLMFPDLQQGLDLIHPNFEYVTQAAPRLRGVVLTHGHEDHIGALPFLLKQVEVPIYGPPYALALVRNRFAEHGIDVEGRLHTVRPGDRFTLGAFDIEPVHVTHSIIDATALVLRTPSHTVVHSGDFSIDANPAFGRQFDAARLREVGDEGVDLLLSDSTNSDVPNRARSEGDVVTALTELIEKAENRLVIALFASNVPRLRGVLAAARNANKKVALLGRSMQNHVRCASNLGYLDVSDSDFVAPEVAQTLPRNRVVVVATGTQGEEGAALHRLAQRTFPHFQLDAGDEVVFSSRVIPGHELAVHRLIDGLERQGVHVHFAGSRPGIHVTGHASRDEQRQLLELVRPRGFVPIHGTYHHLITHAELARQAGVEHAVVVENGQAVVLDSTGVRLGDVVPAGRVYIDAGGAVPEVVIRDRHLLGKLGFALAVVALDAQSRLRPCDVRVITRGVIHEDENQDLLDAAAAYVERALLDERDDSPPDDERLTETARRALKRFFRKRLGRRPLCYAAVVRTPS